MYVCMYVYIYIYIYIYEARNHKLESFCLADFIGRLLWRSFGQLSSMT